MSMLICMIRGIRAIDLQRILSNNESGGHNMIGERIAILRKRNKMSQETLARLIDVSVDTVRRWERETAEPKARDIQRVADALNVQIGAIFGEAITAEPTSRTAQTEGQTITITHGDIHISMTQTPGALKFLKEYIETHAQPCKEPYISTE